MRGSAVTPPLPALATSIVLFQPNLDHLRRTLNSLREALEMARGARAIDLAAVILVDNGTRDEATLDALVAMAYTDAMARHRHDQGSGRRRVQGAATTWPFSARVASTTWCSIPMSSSIGRPSGGGPVPRVVPDHGMVTPHVENDAGGRGFSASDIRRAGARTSRIRARKARSVPSGNCSTVTRCGICRSRRSPPAFRSQAAASCSRAPRAGSRLGGFSPPTSSISKTSTCVCDSAGSGDIAYVPPVRIVHSGGMRRGKAGPTGGSSSAPRSLLQSPRLEALVTRPLPRSVLVTGATGFVGGHRVARSRSAGFRCEPWCGGRCR